MQEGDKLNINLALKPYKQMNGSPNFPALFSIKSENRLPALYAKEPAKIASIVVVGLTMAFETMNLSRPMKAGQIVDLADMILDSSSEDNLSLEDLILFLQRLTRGEYGKLYESMDIPKFMQLFDIYREERHKALQEMRKEQDVQFRALPVNNRLLNVRDILKNDE